MRWRKGKPDWEGIYFLFMEDKYGIGAVFPKIAEIRRNTAMGWTAYFPRDPNPSTYLTEWALTGDEWILGPLPIPDPPLTNE